MRVIFSAQKYDVLHGDTVYFNGDLTAHPDSETIISFIEKRGLKVRWFAGRPLTDIGSILYTDY